MIGNKIVALGYVGGGILAVLVGLTVPPSLLGLFFIFCGLFGFGIAYGLWEEKAWALWIAVILTTISVLSELFEPLNSFEKVFLVAFDIVLVAYLMSIRGEFD